MTHIHSSVGNGYLVILSVFKHLAGRVLNCDGRCAHFPVICYGSRVERYIVRTELFGRRKNTKDFVNRAGVIADSLYNISVIAGIRTSFRNLKRIIGVFYKSFALVIFDRNTRRAKLSVENNCRRIEGDIFFFQRLRIYSENFLYRTAISADSGDCINIAPFILTSGGYSNTVILPFFKRFPRRVFHGNDGISYRAVINDSGRIKRYIVCAEMFGAGGCKEELARLAEKTNLPIIKRVSIHFEIVFSLRLKISSGK